MIVTDLTFWKIRAKQREAETRNRERSKSMTTEASCLFFSFFFVCLEHYLPSGKEMRVETSAVYVREDRKEMVESCEL